MEYTCYYCHKAYDSIMDLLSCPECHNRICHSCFRPYVENKEINQIRSPNKLLLNSVVNGISGSCTSCYSNFEFQFIQRIPLKELPLYINANWLLTKSFDMLKKRLSNSSEQSKAIVPLDEDKYSGSV